MNVHSGYAKPILKMAQRFGLVGSQYAWVVTDGTMNDAVSSPSADMEVISI